MGLTLNGAGNLVTMDMGKGQGTSPQSSLIRLAFRNPRHLTPVGKSGLRKSYSWWGRIKLGKLDIHKSMGPHGVHPQGLRELANVTVRLMIKTGRSG